MIRKLILIFILIVSYISVQSQVDNKYAREYDYFNHNYKYLDANFEIRISKDLFQSLVVQYKYYPNRIRSCKDSLNVVLMGEFDNWDMANIGMRRLTYSYLRLSYYLWFSEEETKSMCEKFNFIYPYHLIEYIRYKELEWNEEMKIFMNLLRLKVKKATNNPEVMEMDVGRFLGYALLNNPQRIKDYEAMKSKRAKGDVSCGKKDCCQDKQK